MPGLIRTQTAKPCAAKTKMGMLEGGRYFTVGQIERHAEELREITIKQLIKIWPSVRERAGSSDLWGDEVEYQLVEFDHSKKEVQLLPLQSKVLRSLDDDEQFQIEYAKWMVESNPPNPHSSNIRSLLAVESSMKSRRNAIRNVLNLKQAPFTISGFPAFSVEGTRKALGLAADCSAAQVYDAAAAPVPRYQVLRQNIPHRSGKDYRSIVPIFQDERTDLSSELTNGRMTGGLKTKNFCLELEDLAHTMGGCGLQATFQATSLNNVRLLYDRLVVLGPLFLALTAATPIYCHTLVDTDARWNQACSMIDDRRQSELEHLTTRWGLSPAYLSQRDRLPSDCHSAIETKEESISSRLRKAGLDPDMAGYYSLLLQRDPLVLSGDEDKISELDPDELFSGICKTVWQHVRLTMPPLMDTDSTTAGWRVEIRTMEAQFTDLASGSFVVTLELLRQALTFYDIDLYIPLKLVADNMERAHTRDGARREKFWFRTQPQRDNSPADFRSDLREMSLDQVMNGTKNGDDFVGFIPLIKRYMVDSGMRSSTDSKEDIDRYLDYVRDIASGQRPTPARWMREFVTGHKEYRRDSHVPQSICYDMLLAMMRMNDE